MHFTERNNLNKHSLFLIITGIYKSEYKLEILL